MKNTSVKVNRIMAHLVAYYPSGLESEKAAKALADGGVSFLEIQFPFSDPSADGPAIEHANSEALKAGFSTEKGLELIRNISSYTDVPIYIMGYANTFFVQGIQSFLTRLKEAGAEGIIVPDLPPGSDEGLYKAARQVGINAVPVIIAGTEKERLETVLSVNPKYVYVALRRGITGKESRLGPWQAEFLENIEKTGIKALGGFGIQSYEAAKEVNKHAYAAVVGSEIVRTIDKTLELKDDIYTIVNRKARDLVYGENK